MSVIAGSDYNLGLPQNANHSPAVDAEAVPDVYSSEPLINEIESLLKETTDDLKEDLFEGEDIDIEKFLKTQETKPGMVTCATCAHSCPLSELGLTAAPTNWVWLCSSCDEEFMEEAEPLPSSIFAREE